MHKDFSHAGDHLFRTTLIFCGEMGAKTRAANGGKGDCGGSGAGVRQAGILISHFNENFSSSRY